MEYQSYLGWGLNNFEDIVEAFTKYKDGGWWIRKIDYKDAFNREITEGPYTEKEAKRKAINWDKFFKFKEKNIKTAKAYSFNDLVCRHEKDYNFLKNHLYEEYIWRPPKGTELMCLLSSKEKVLLLKKEEKENVNLSKFKMYVQDNNIKIIDYQGYEIYFKDKDYMANEQVKKLKLLIDDYKDKPEELIWLYDKALNKHNKRGLESLVTPYYIKTFNKDDKPYDLDFFKRLENCKTQKAKINTLLCFLKDSKREISFPYEDKNKFNLSYHFPLLYGKEDYDIKNLNISFLNEKELLIEIKEKDYYVKLRDHYLTFNLPLSNDENKVFNDKLLALMLFIAKTLSIDDLILTDNLQEYCRCDKNYSVRINIVRFLAGQESIYEEMGFVEENKEKREKIINEMKDKKIKDFINLNEEDIFKEKTLMEISQDYLDGYCEFPYICNLLNQITDKLKDSQFDYSINLKDFPLFKLKEKLK